MDTEDIVQAPEAPPERPGRRPAGRAGRLGALVLLLRRKLVSPQEAEQAFANSEIAAETLQTQETLRGYERILAPFDGTVTERLADPGALNASGGSLALYTVSSLDTLRVFVYVDQ